MLALIFAERDGTLSDVLVGASGLGLDKALVAALAAVSCGLAFAFPRAEERVVLGDIVVNEVKKL